MAKIGLLALRGFHDSDDGKMHLNAFESGFQPLLRASNRLLRIDADADMEGVAQLAPVGRHTSSGVRAEGAADGLLDLVVQFIAGNDVAEREIQSAPDPFPRESLASQAAQIAAKASVAAAADGAAAADDVAADGPARKVRRQSVPVVEANESTMSKYREVLTPMLKMLVTTRTVRSSFCHGFEV